MCSWFLCRPVPCGADPVHPESSAAWGGPAGWRGLSGYRFPSKGGWNGSECEGWSGQCEHQQRRPVPETENVLLRWIHQQDHLLLWAAQQVDQQRWWYEDRISSVIICETLTMFETVCSQCSVWFFVLFTKSVFTNQLTCVLKFIQVSHQTHLNTCSMLPNSTRTVENQTGVVPVDLEWPVRTLSDNRTFGPSRTENTRLNFLLLLMNGVRVVFTKTLAFSTILTIRAVLVWQTRGTEDWNQDEIRAINWSRGLNQRKLDVFVETWKTFCLTSVSFMLSLYCRCILTVKSAFLYDSRLWWDEPFYID